MNINMNTLKHFKTDGVVWEMKFLEYDGGFFGSHTLNTSYVRGECYTGTYKNKQPCFNSVSYDDPMHPVYLNEKGVIEKLSSVEESEIETLYKCYFIKDQLKDAIPQERSL